MRSFALVLAGVLLAGVAPTAAEAAAKRPAAPKSVASTLAGTTLTVTWKATASGKVEARVKTPSTKATANRATTSTAASARAKTTIVTRSTKASKGRLTVTVKGAEGATLQASAVRVQLRRCTGSGKATRCSAYGAWKQPTSPKIPGPVTGPSPQTTPAPAPAPSSPVPTGDVPSIGGCPVFPADHAFNQDVSGFPLDPKSDAYIASIGAGGRVHPDFGAADLGQGPGGFGIPYRVVPATQPLVDVKLDWYKEESDGVNAAGEGRYPVPLDTPVEGGPSSDGDRHVLVVQQGNGTDPCKLYELGNAYPQSSAWKASGGAIWDLNTGLRPPTAKPGWTSADAAGLPILPGLVRYDEVAAGAIKHAVRFTVANSQRAYVAPASHYASSSTDPNRPPMGLRLRMRSSFDTSKFKGQSLVVVTALKKYGMIVADNGSNWYVSGAADPRWNDDDLNQLKGIPGNAFEVVKTGELVTG